MKIVSWMVCVGVAVASAGAKAQEAVRLENTSSTVFGYIFVGDIDLFELQTLTIECAFTPQGSGFGKTNNDSGTHIVSTHIDESTVGQNGLSWALRWSPETELVNAAVTADPDGPGGEEALDSFFEGTTMVPEGQPAHAALVFEGGMARIFVNGLLEAEGDHPTPVFYGDGVLKFGAGESGNGFLRRFDGTIDEVRIWSIARSAEEIAATLDCRLQGDEPGLLGLWNLDGDLTDSGPNAADGTFVGTGTFVAEPIVLNGCLSTFQNLGQGLAGALGEPLLAGFGALVGGTPVSLTVSNAPAQTNASLVVGLSALNAPFKGGVLVPAPDVLITGLATSLTGTLNLVSEWPDGFPSATSTWFQFWMPDASGPNGFVATNALLGVTP